MSPVKILVIEDESIVAMDIKRRLENMNYQVPEIISSGEEAIENTLQISPDLVLMDIVLRGEVDGIKAAQVIKDKYNIPVVYLTAYSDEKTLKRAKITGPFGYIIKPFEDRELHSAIEVALYKHEMESKLRANEKWLYTTLESIGEAVITTDKGRKITFINPIAQKLTGWEQEEAIGNPIYNVLQLYNAETGELIDLSLDNLISNINENIILVNKYGNKIPINSTNAPIIDDNNRNTGFVLVFQDISQRKIAEKEREQLLKEKARSELFGFLLSAMPVFASNIPPQIRNNIAKSFADRFEKNIRPGFERDFFKCITSTPDDFHCYMEWIEEFLSNLGIDVEKTPANNNTITFSNCPWENEAKYSPMFCLICRTIVIRSFTWTSIKGHVEQVSSMADENEGCMFQFNLSNNDVNSDNINQLGKEDKY